MNTFNTLSCNYQICEPLKSVPLKSVPLKRCLQDLELWTSHAQFFGGNTLICIVNIMKF